MSENVSVSQNYVLGLESDVQRLEREIERLRGKIGGIKNELHGRIDELNEEIERLQSLLREHHDWHLSQGEVSAPDGKGGYVTWDASEAYSDSDLCERTYNALPYTSPQRTNETKD